MSLFKRMRGILSKSEPSAPERSIMTAAPGDICEVSLVTYRVAGRTHDVRRRSAVLTLQDGSDIRYLLIEEREQTYYSLYAPIDGRLDSIREVPVTLELDGILYRLEEQYAGMVTAVGRTPFAGGELSVWQYQSDDSRLLRIEWMDGRFMLYEGEDVLPADVEWIRSGG